MRTSKVEGAVARQAWGCRHAEPGLPPPSRRTTTRQPLASHTALTRTSRDSSAVTDRSQGLAAMEAEAAAEPEPPPLAPQHLVVPSSEAVAVEYPAFVRNPQRALQTLGGLEAVAAAVASKKRYPVLPLRFRPEDRFCHALFGEREAGRTRFLLRLAKPKQQQQEQQRDSAGAGAPPAGEGQAGPAARSDTAAGAQPPQLSVSLLARVTATVRYNGLADFVYLPIDPAGSTRPRPLVPPDQRPSMAEPTASQQPLLLIPQLFSWTDMPGDFALRKSPAVPAGAAGCGGGGGGGRSTAAPGFGSSGAGAPGAGSGLDAPSHVTVGVTVLCSLR
jgi:hypothetical protein